MNKVILFWPDNDKKRGDYQEWRRIGLRMLRSKLLSTPDIFLIFLYYHIFSIFFHSCSQVFPGMIASDSCSRNVGMDFFSIPSHSLILGMFFVRSLPVPELPVLVPVPNSQKSFPLTPVSDLLYRPTCLCKEVRGYLTRCACAHCRIDGSK